MNTAKIIAYYLPQFHPVPENDKWWGTGFTEWTNVGRAKPLFKGHYQPRVPADLGYYDLRLPKIRKQQAEMAQYAGIEGFCYWHYWFAGKRLLEQPFNEIIQTGTPDFPFCLAWANESWTGVWNNDHKRILIEQTYPGREDVIKHFYANLQAFKDSRYIKVEGRIVFVIYKPLNLPNAKEFIDLWNNLAVQNGLQGFYFIAVSTNPTYEVDKILSLGYDAVNVYNLKDVINKTSIFSRINKGISRKFFAGRLSLTKYEYEEIIENWINGRDYQENIIPTILPQWDNSPRSGRRAIIINNSTPNKFDKHVKSMLNLVSEKENKLLFLKSWNEWAEGNYVEPDLRYGKGYVDVLRKNLLAN